MSDQKVVYQVDLNDAQALAAFRNMESGAMSFERSLAGVQNTLGELGIAFSVQAMYEFGKSFIETTTKLESYKNLIKFASENTKEAAENQREINDAVKDFKLPIMETYQEFSQLMAMVKGTPVEGEKTRQMFTNLAETLTILHLPAEKVKSAIGGIGKLLEEGNLQPRYLRPLIATLPGFGINLANEMGISYQKLNEDINKGVLTHTNAYAYIPKVLEDIKKMYDEHLPEALNSYMAQTAELKNAWIEFQEDIGNKIKPEVISLYYEIEGGLRWLKENEEAIIAVGKAILKITEFVIAYKIAMGTINLALATYRSVASLFVSETVTQTVAYGEQTLAVNALTAAIERLNFVTNASGANFLVTEGGIIANTAGNRYIASAESAGIAGAEGIEAAEGVAAIGSVISGGALIVGGVILYGIWTAIKEFSGNFGKDGQDRENAGKDWDDNKITEEILNHTQASLKYGLSNGQYYLDQDKALAGTRFRDMLQTEFTADMNKGDKKSTLAHIKDIYSDILNNPEARKLFLIKSGDHSKDEAIDNYITEEVLKYRHQDEATKGARTGIVPRDDKITGQRVITYNIHIKDIIGQKVERQTIENASDVQIEHIMEEVARGLEAIVYDTQIHGND